MLTESRIETSPRAEATVEAPRLRAHALGFPPLLAQSVAAISPTMTAVLIIPLAFLDAGQGTWAAYLFATVMLLFVVFGLNQFARRSATAGSMYAYTARGLGPVAGVLSGWTLIWSYLFIAVAGLSGFSIFASQLLSTLGVNGVSPFFLFAVSGAYLHDGRVEGHSALVTVDAPLRGALGGVHPGSRRRSCSSSTGFRSTPRSYSCRASACAAWTSRS